MNITPEKIAANRRNALLGGRPKGLQTAEVKLRRKVERQVQVKIMKMADKLINAQSIIALGTHKIVTISIDPQTNEKHVNMVNDEKEIDRLIETGKYGEDYLIIVGKAGDWKSANALLDRALGKAKENIKLDIEHTFSLKELAERRETLQLEVDDVKIIDVTAEDKI